MEDSALMPWEKVGPQFKKSYKRAGMNGTSLSEISITGFVSDLFKNVP